MDEIEVARAVKVRADQNQMTEYKVDLSCPHIQTPERSIRPLANIHH